jgi:hypothetical protein
MPEGTRRGGGGSKSLKPDPFVEKLMPNPAEAPEGTRFVGLLGKSTREGYWRLYLDASLRDYLEIAEEDILTSEQFDPATSPIGGTMLTVRSDAQITRSRVCTTEARNAFLQGAIASRFLRGARPQAPTMLRPAARGGGGGGLGAHTDPDIWCKISHIFSCATHDPDDPVCAGHTELPGTADSCGMCSTYYNCGFYGF